MRRFTLASLVAAITLCASASSATAAVTIGQTTPPDTFCGDDIDRVQPTVTSGNTYVMPADGVITSWSTHANSNSGASLTMKVFRPLGGLTYQVVGHEGPHTLTPSVLDTFPANIVVKAGDVLGNFVPASTMAVPAPGCMFFVSAESHLRHLPGLADGQSSTFDPVADLRLNISAVLEPDCDKDGLGDETQDTNTSSCTALICKGAKATIIGTAGNDVRSGTPGRDVMVGQGGNDSLSGLAGNDLLCGAAGKDTLKGGKGKDTLLGQKGKDTLKGGGGKDICKGGKGNDSASKCEVEKSI